MSEFPYADRIRALAHAPVPAPGVCFGCGLPLTDRWDAVLIFICPAPQYVRDMARLPRIGHSRCGPGQYKGDTVDLAQLVLEGGGATAIAFYTSYPWWEPEFAGWLEMAHAVGAALDGAPATMRCVSESIPRRIPRPPANPRAISPAVRSRVFERDEFRCRRCGCGPNDAPLVIDHIVPVAKGGTGAFGNLQTLCQPCNAGKRDRAPHPHDLAGASRG